jgi:hypothetical protein
MKLAVTGQFFVTVMELRNTALLKSGMKGETDTDGMAIGQRI